MPKFKATLTLTVEAEDEAGAKLAFRSEVGNINFDTDSIEVEKEAE